MTYYLVTDPTGDLAFISKSPNGDRLRHHQWVRTRWSDVSLYESFHEKSPAFCPYKFKTIQQLINDRGTAATEILATVSSWDEFRTNYPEYLL